MKLLIAEDSLTIRMMLEAITRKWGFDPVLAEDGQQAWDILSDTETAPPHLVLLDWEMPGMNGPEICERERARKRDDPPYMILLTSRSETIDIVAGLEAGANDYIAKPFDNTELHARLQVGRRMLDLQSELKAANETLAFQASHDFLTGLLNRSAVLETMAQKMKQGTGEVDPLQICLCDIDHFKRINDTYGHLAGDAILREVARRLNATIGPGDCVGRYGGEEFLLLLNMDTANAPELLEQLRLAIGGEPFVHEQQTLQVTVSIGATSFSPPQDERNATALLATADAAMYEAKAAGRDQVVFDPGN